MVGRLKLKYFIAEQDKYTETEKVSGYGQDSMQTNPRHQEEETQNNK